MWLYNYLGGGTLKYIAYCGLKCNECPIFIATTANDDSLRIKLAREYSTKDCTFSKEDMNCFGCHSDKINHSKMCGQCKIRSCPNTDKLSSCAECINFPCELIERYVPVGTENRETLDKINVHLKLSFTR